MILLHPSIYVSGAVPACVFTSHCIMRSLPSSDSGQQVDSFVLVILAVTFAPESECVLRRTTNAAPLCGIVWQHCQVSRVSSYAALKHHTGCPASSFAASRAAKRPSIVAGSSVASARRLILFEQMHAHLVRDTQRLACLGVHQHSHDSHASLPGAQTDLPHPLAYRRLDSVPAWISGASRGLLLRTTSPLRGPVMVFAGCET